MKFSIIFLFFAIVFGLFGLGYMHEQVHVEIFRSYGIESHVEYFSHFPDLVTIPEENCPTNECILAHNMNEVVGYPLMIVYTVFTFLIFCLITFSEFKIDQNFEIIKLLKEIKLTKGVQDANI